MQGTIAEEKEIRIIKVHNMILETRGFLDADSNSCSP